MISERSIDVTVLGESVLADSGWYTETVRQFKDGTLIACGGLWQSNWNDPDPGSWYNVSTDKGLTWQEYVRPDGGPDHRLDATPFLCQRSDTSVLGWVFSRHVKSVYQGHPGQPVVYTIMRAPSWEALIRGQKAMLKATCYVPHLVPGVGDDFKTRYGLAFFGKMVEMEGGDLIQAVHTCLACDRAPRHWAEQKVPASQTRTCVIYSQDGGASWHYLATVASPDLYSLPPQAEDGGLSRTPPFPISPYGVSPGLLRMSNGLVVCLSGRPGFFLLFSNDGKTWSSPHGVSQSHGAFGRSSSGAHPADVFDQSGGTMAHHTTRGDYVACISLTHGARRPVGCLRRILQRRLPGHHRCHRQEVRGNGVPGQPRVHRRLQPQAHRE